MAHLLFPGRHLLNTIFQAHYLEQILVGQPETLDWFDGQKPTFALRFDQVIFAVTSANQSNSRYNPIPFYVRAIGVDRFAHALQDRIPFRYRILGIPHYSPTERFARYILKEIEYQSEGNLRLTPENCAIICSTPGVASLFKELGFSILPAEASTPPGGFPSARPIELLSQLVGIGEKWPDDPVINQALSSSTRKLWLDFPDVPRRIIRLWRDPLLNETGDLTSGRDYSSYASRMSNHEIISLKYTDIKGAILSGKIVDEGCGDGALLVPIARDFPDSDLIGLEITGEFIARGQERQRAGEYGGTFVHFHQRNITDRVFEDNSIDTTLCNSTMHELWSYGDGSETIRNYLLKKFRQTRPGGRLIIRDVVGPADKHKRIFLWLNDRDGHDDNVFLRPADPQLLEDHLNNLSTYARFRRFAEEFLADPRRDKRRPANTKINVSEEEIGGRRYLVLKLKDAVEFLTKKDYTNNWYSELHEEFAYWEFSEWKQALTSAGFRVIENPNEPEVGSRVYTNPWIVENRWQGKARLYEMINGRLEPMAFPPTTMILVGQKPG